MALGFSRREQWTLLGVLAVMIGGIAYESTRQPQGLADLGVDSTGRWERVATFRAGQGPGAQGAIGLTTGTAARNARAASSEVQSGHLAAPGRGQAPPRAGSNGVAAQGIDLNSATAEDLDKLPGIGPVRARDILALRAQRGRFQSVDELGDVKGIGPVTLEKLRPFVFVAPPDGPAASGAARDGAAPPAAVATPHLGAIAIGPATAAPQAGARDAGAQPWPTPFPDTTSLQNFVPPPVWAAPNSWSYAPPPVPYVKLKSTASSPRRVMPALAHRINVNTAGYEELQELPGVGPVTARAILADRQLHGYYRSLADMERIKGIGPATVAKIAAVATVN